MLSHRTCLQVFNASHVLFHMPIMHMLKHNHMGSVPLSTAFRLFLPSSLLTPPMALSLLFLCIKRKAASQQQQAWLTDSHTPDNGNWKCSGASDVIVTSLRTRRFIEQLAENMMVSKLKKGVFVVTGGCKISHLSTELTKLPELLQGWGYNYRRDKLTAVAESLQN